MKTPGFIFGGNTDWTYDQLQSKRKIADLLAARTTSNAPQNVGEGLSAIGQALLVRSMNKKADKRDGELKGEFDKQWSGIFGALGGGGESISPSGFPPPPGPNQDIADETMTALGKRPDFGAVEAQYNLPAGYLDRTFQIESGGNPNAQNPNSTAGGGFQFIDSTAKQYGLTDKTDLNASTDAAARLAVDNRQALRRVLGRDPTAAELYLAHQQGGGGAAKLLANPDARAVDIVGRDAVMLNGGNENMTAGQFAQKWTGKFGGQDRAAGQVAGGGAGMDLQALAEVAGSPYASPGQKAVAQSLLQQQMQANDPAAMLDLEYKRAQIASLNARAGAAGQVDPAQVQSSEILADGSTVMVMKDGNRMVRLPSGDVVEGAAAAEAIRAARDYDVQNQQAIYSGRRTGTNIAEATTGGDAAYAGTAGDLQAKTDLGGEAARVAAAGAERGKSEVRSMGELREMERNLPGLLQVADQLESLAEKATYTYAGQIRDFLNKQVGGEPTEGAIARAQYIAVVDNQVLPLLRQTFGAAFTAKEGETLKNTLGDPNKSPAEKKAVLNAFIEQKKRDLIARGGAVTPEPGDDVPVFNPDTGMWE